MARSRSRRAASRSTPLAAWTSDLHRCVTSFAEGLGAARGMAFAPNGDLLVVQRQRLQLATTLGAPTMLAPDGTLSQGTRAVRPVATRQRPRGERNLSDDNSAQRVRAVALRQ